MNPLRVAFPLLLASASAVLAQGTVKDPTWLVEPLTRDGWVAYEFDSGLIVGTNGIIVRYGDVTLTAESASVNQATGETVAEGGVRIQRQGALWTSDRLSYNFLTGVLSADSFKTGFAPFFLGGDRLRGDQTNKTFAATNALVTTDDYARPSHYVRARSLTIAGRSFEARQATVYLGGVPVMYLPYYTRYLGRHPNNFEFQPGYRSRDGAYLLSTYNFTLSEEFDGAVRLDARSKRGLAGGPDFNYHAGPWAEDAVRYYYAYDLDPAADPSIPPVPNNRQRVWFSHATMLTNFTAKAMVRYQSDAYIVRDFFENEYRENVQPNSFLELNQLWPNFSLNLLAQPRLNEFFETVERLPDIKFSALRQRLGVSPFYYESDSSFGWFRHQFTNNASPEFSAIRADTFHQLLLPQTLFGWLTITPRAGGRFTYYGEAEGPGATTTAQDRWVFNTGAELSFKVSRVWPQAHSRLLEVNGLRHIMQPLFNYAYVPKPSALPPELPQFDTELPSFRPLPLNFPDYNSIDSIDSEHVVRLGLRNKVQTKREDGVENLLNWELFTDWRIQPRPDQGTFSDVYSSLDLKPRSWITLTSEIRYDVENGRFRMANHYLTVQPGGRWSVALGHRYLRDDPALGPDSGNDLFTTSIYYRVNENWGFRMSHHFEASDGVMEEQQYTIYRDLRSWTAALSCRFRDQRSGGSDFGVALTFSLKAFPRYKPGGDTDKPTLLLGH